MEIIKEIIDFEFDEDLLSIINDIYLGSRYPGEIGLIFTKEIETKIKNELNKNK